MGKTKEWSPLEEVVGDDEDATFVNFIKWANFDVLNEDGSVYLAASEPIPIYNSVPTPSIDPTAMLLGWLVGKQIAGQRGNEPKKIVAYLYNSVELPELPEWDKTVYPYAVITMDVDSDVSYWLYVFAENACCFEGITGTLFFGGQSSNPAPCIRWLCDYQQSPIPSIPDPGYGWRYRQEFNNQNVFVDKYNNPNEPKYADTLLWSNFDIEYDGTLYLAASEPIPVYE